MQVNTSKYKYGNYMCIPSWNTGTEMVDMENVRWNRERLMGRNEVSGYL